MENKQSEAKYNYKNIAAALAAVLLIVVGISSSCNKNASVKKSADLSSSTAVTSSVVKKDEGIHLTANYKYESVANKTGLVNGNLLIIGMDNKFVGSTDNTESIYKYLFDTNGTQIMSASSTNLLMSSVALKSLNSMVDDFYKKTNLTTLMISRVIDESDTSSTSTASTSSSADGSNDVCGLEHASGLAVDFMTYNASTGAYPAFDGSGDYSWINDNCYKYGFILRYPKDKTKATKTEYTANHFRYVGKPHAEIMKKKKLCLEEYIAMLKKYDFENPLSYKSEDGTEYALYYVKKDKGTATNIPVPYKDSDIEYTHEISGDNSDGYVVTVTLSETKTSSENSIDETSSELSSDDTAESTADDASTADTSITDDVSSDVMM